MIFKVTGRYGGEEEITKHAYVSIRSKGGMDASLFRMYIRDIILPLYPNISKDCIMENGKVIKGPVFLKTYSGPGRFKEDIEHILFLEHMNSIGLNIILSLPNGTSVHAELD